MSLNGLDDARVTEAYEAAVAEPGGWYVLIPPYRYFIFGTVVRRTSAPRPAGCSSAMRPLSYLCSQSFAEIQGADM